MNCVISGRHIYTEKPVLREETMHSHDTYEIFCLLTGDADYCVEGNRYPLQCGDLMLMRKGEVHIFQLRSAAPYERIYINFDIPDVLEFLDAEDLLCVFNDRPLGKYNHYPASLLPNNHWQEYMDSICRQTDQRKQLCYLLPLLRDLNDRMDAVKTAPALSEKDHAAPIIRYINDHLTDELSLEMLSQRFYISKTHLLRLFKKATGTTVWEYITIKRLFLARERITSGLQPTDVYSQCGFKDYTTFFRAYKQHFGVSPKYHGPHKEAFE